MLFHAAPIIKAEIKAFQGIEMQPLHTGDLTLNRTNSVIPDTFMNFLSWVTVQQRTTI